MCVRLLRWPVWRWICVCEPDPSLPSARCSQPSLLHLPGRGRWARLMTSTPISHACVVPDSVTSDRKQVWHCMNKYYSYKLIFIRGRALVAGRFNNAASYLKPYCSGNANGSRKALSSSMSWSLTWRTFRGLLWRHISFVYSIMTPNQVVFTPL